MKIGIDARFYRSSTGGIGRYTRALLNELAKIDKINDYLVYITPDDEKEYSINAKNFQSKIIPIKHYSLKEQTDFLNILNKDNLDIVHFTNFNHPLYYKKKFIITIHDLTMLFFPTKKLQRSLIGRIAFLKTMKNAIKSSQKVIAISKATKNDIISHFSADSQKIKVIYEGIDENYKIKLNRNIIDKVKNKYHLKKPYILFVSQWRPHKGLPELIKAFDILKNKYKIPHQLVLIGKPNSDFPDVIEAIEKSKHINNIIRPGFIDEKDLPVFYKGADLFVFPSFYEGFGLPPLEAMASGVPVIASNTSCIPEILGSAAEYFDPSKPEEIAKTINLIISNTKKLSKMSNLGILQAKKYSWRKMAEETLKIYQNIS